jgi:DNA-directed RNA polymerase specialized sigma24 family protein
MHRHDCANLTDLERAAVLAKEAKEPYSEIAKSAKTSVGAIKQAMWRAKAKLAKAAESL